jgi:hypothetical protein
MEVLRHEPYPLPDCEGNGDGGIEMTTRDWREGNDRKCNSLSRCAVSLTSGKCMILKAFQPLCYDRQDWDISSEATRYPGTAVPQRGEVGRTWKR